jgi:SAM-dependent methyltransferase
MDKPRVRLWTCVVSPVARLAARTRGGGVKRWTVTIDSSEKNAGAYAWATGRRQIAKPIMDPRDLPLLGPVTNGGKDVFGSFTDLRSKRLLCIGFSEREIDELVAKYRPSEIVLLTKWTDHADAHVRKYRLVVGDITQRTVFADRQFDAILTLSVLEHLPDLGAAFDEMTRLVPDGGELVHMFGPVWSSAYGHHVYERADDRLFDFSQWKLPAHIHLLCSRDELIRYYVRNGYTEHEGWVAHYWFHEVPLINRVFYDDYMRIFEEDRFQLDRAELMYNALPRSHLAHLRSRYPGRRDFSTYGGKYKLIVRKS